MAGESEAARENSMRDFIHAERRGKLRGAFLFPRAAVLRVSTGRKWSTNL